MDEVAAATAVLNAHSRALHGVDDCAEVEIEEVWRAPEVTFPADVFLAERDGHAVGYADVIPFGKTSWVDVRATDPEAYDSLLEAATRRAEEQHMPHIRAYAVDQDAPARTAIERAGYRPIRYGFRMLTELDGSLPAPEWPDGYTVRAYRDGDAKVFHRVHQDSFADTWEFTSEPLEPWAHWFMGALFQPEHWFVVEAGDEQAAIAISHVSKAEPDSGWVRILGVLPAHRRRGVGMALLQHLFGHFAEHGMRRVQLGVDGENPTGAVALYERAGMHVLRRNVTYERLPG